MSDNYGYVDDEYEGVPDWTITNSSGGEDNFSSSLWGYIQSGGEAFVDFVQDVGGLAKDVGLTIISALSPALTEVAKQSGQITTQVTSTLQQQSQLEQQLELAKLQQQTELQKLQLQAQQSDTSSDTPQVIVTTTSSDSEGITKYLPWILAAGLAGIGILALSKRGK